jgi:hypothetical protein
MSSAGADEIIYQHTQRGWLTLLGFAMGLLAQGVSAARDIRAGRRRVWSYVPVMAIYAFAVFVFSSLTVAVRPPWLQATFAGGLFRRSVDLTAVKTAAVITVPWYYGWGVRVTPHGLLYSVSGRSAVRVTQSDGRAFTVGSDEPYLLLSAIEQARRAAEVDT